MSYEVLGPESTSWVGADEYIDAPPGKSGGLSVNAKGVEGVTSLLKTTGRVLGGMAIGTILATIGLSLAWRAHRVIGGLLGFFVVGPVAGGGAGYLLSLGDIKKIEASNETGKGPGKKELDIHWPTRTLSNGDTITRGTRVVDYSGRFGTVMYPSVPITSDILDRNGKKTGTDTTDEVAVAIDNDPGVGPAGEGISYYLASGLSKVK